MIEKLEHLVILENIKDLNIKLINKSLSSGEIKEATELMEIFI